MTIPSFEIPSILIYAIIALLILEGANIIVSFIQYILERKINKLKTESQRKLKIDNPPYKFLINGNPIEVDKRWDGFSLEERTFATNCCCKFDDNDKCITLCRRHIEICSNERIEHKVSRVKPSLPPNPRGVA